MSPTNSESTARRSGLSREIGTTGVQISPIGVDGSIFGWAAGVDETASVLDRFAEAGGSFISTADHYAGGRSEVMIGSWLRDHHDRAGIVLATKVGRHPDAAGLSPCSIVRAVEASLERLGTDYLDFLSFDGEDPKVPIAESLDAVAELVAAGKVRFLSASGYSPQRLSEISAIAAKEQLPAFRAVVVEYNLMERGEYESGIDEIVAADGRSAIARMPLAGGYLTGRYRTRDEVPDSVMFAGASRYVGRRGSRILDAIDEIAAELGETPSRVAIAWVLVKPGIACAVVRAKDTEQLDEAIAAIGVRLSRHQVALLDRVSAHG